MIPSTGSTKLTTKRSGQVLIIGEERRQLTGDRPGNNSKKPFAA